MLFEQEFEKMLQQYQTSVNDRKKFSGLVKDFFPDQPKNANLLLMAYNIGIAEDIEKTSRINNTFAFRFVKQLMDDFGLSRANADWIVSVWCVCYGSRILGKACEINLQQQGSGPAIKEQIPASSSGKQYGDLFTYKKSIQANGLSVTGFHGAKKQTIIFQNMSGNHPVVDIGEQSFTGEAVEAAILAEGIAFVGARAFADCNLLHQVVLPMSIKEIGDSSFENCVSLKLLSLPIQLQRIGKAALKGSGLKTISIPKSVYWIGEEAFAYCEDMDNVVIPDNIDQISKGMFEGCTKLKKIKLHEHLDRIGDRAFFGCSRLDYIVMPDSVNEIGLDAFSATDKQFIVQCTFGSYAEEYCRKNKIKYQLV